jgi:OmpA-OmpF porin, OOP family
VSLQDFFELSFTNNLELSMKKKLLCCALFGAMAMAQSAVAQDFDDRWYISGTAGIFAPDDLRLDADNAPLYGIGVGKMVTPNVSVDIQFDHSHPRYSILPDRQINVNALGLDGRYHFVKEGRNWWPYLVGGVGASRNNSDALNIKETNLYLKGGAGLQADVSERVDLRFEAGLRREFNDRFGSDGLLDTYAAASVLFALGNLDAPVAPEQPMAPKPADDCSTKDDDGDGVNNCNDKCPNSQAGQAIGPDGCPVPLTIDLKGVNFDFDKDTLRPDAVAILDEAADILNKYPQLRVEVAGHTDSVGTDAYNQNLSQRRAQVVYNYLTGKGVDAGRLTGPNGFGEAKPIDVNTTKEGRARNRRTELNVQN